MRLHLAFWCLVLAILQESMAQASSGRAPTRLSCERVQLEDAIGSITAGGELELASGRTIKLLDIRFPERENDLKRPLAWLQSLAGRRVAVAALAAGADR
jgi:endonuclease YncB( thermonuclease family)